HHPGERVGDREERDSASHAARGAEDDPRKRAQKRPADHSVEALDREETPADGDVPREAKPLEPLARAAPLREREREHRGSMRIPVLPAEDAERERKERIAVLDRVLEKPRADPDADDERHDRERGDDPRKRLSSPRASHDDEREEKQPL